MTTNRSANDRCENANNIDPWEKVLRERKSLFRRNNDGYHSIEQSYKICIVGIKISSVMFSVAWTGVFNKFIQVLFLELVI